MVPVLVLITANRLNTKCRASLASSVIEAMPGNNDLSRPGPGRLQELLQSEPMRTRAVLQPFGDDVLRDAFTLKPGVIQDVYGLLQNAKRNPGL